MTDIASIEPQVELSDELVTAYLRQHPDFFHRHESLLTQLSIPNHSGTAISLAERQVQVFREERDALRARLDELVSVARDNDQHFEKSKRLLLNLLEINSLDEIEIVVNEIFKNDSNVHCSSLVIFESASDFPFADLSLVSHDEAKQALGNLYDTHHAVCGTLEFAQKACLFPKDYERVESAAVMPLNYGSLLGMFSLGSEDEAHFNPAMGSLFLSYIGEVISRLIPNLLLQAKTHSRQEHVPSLLD